MANLILQFIGQPFVIMIAITLLVMAISWLLFNMLIRIYLQQRNAEILVTNTQSPLIRAILPTARMLGLGIRELFGRNKKSAYQTFTHRLEREITSAGRPEGLSVDEFVGCGILSGGLWCVIAMIFIFILNPEKLFVSENIFYLLLAFIFGMITWKSWLNNKRQIRQVAVKRQLPFVLDLLTLAMEAGMDFTSALARIVSKTGKTPLGIELSLMLHEIQLGKTRADALRDLSNRCDVQDLRTVTASLIQAEELGSSLGTVLRIQAVQQRERRSQTAEEKAMKAPVKMLLPMIFILAALFVIMCAPIALAYLENM